MGHKMEASNEFYVYLSCVPSSAAAAGVLYGWPLLGGHFSAQGRERLSRPANLKNLDIE
jgi:hypothetical protein